MDFANKCNVGYAFINFTDAQCILEFVKHHVGKRWAAHGSDKVCRLSYANIQGKSALIDKFRNSAVMEKDPSYRPLVFDKYGREESFPGPSIGGRRDLTLSDDDDDDGLAAGLPEKEVLSVDTVQVEALADAAVDGNASLFLKEKDAP